MAKGLTARYPHGELSLGDHVAFLAQYYAARPPGPFHAPTSKSEQRGEISHLRDALRATYPGWHCTVRSIRAALGSNPAWAAWYEEVFWERKEKLEARREARGRDRKTGRKLSERSMREDGSEEVEGEEELHEPTTPPKSTLSRTRNQAERAVFNEGRFRVLLLKQQREEAENAIAEMLASRQETRVGDEEHKTAPRRQKLETGEATLESTVTVQLPERALAIVMQRTVVRVT